MICLRELPKLLGFKAFIKVIYYTLDDLTANIDGEKMITFTPNTITYAVPLIVILVVEL